MALVTLSLHLPRPSVVFAEQPSRSSVKCLISCLLNLPVEHSVEYARALHRKVFEQLEAESFLEY